MAYDADAKMEKDIEIIGQFIEDNIPMISPVDDLRARALELFKREQRKRMDDFYENLGRISRGVF